MRSDLRDSQRDRGCQLTAAAGTGIGRWFEKSQLRLPAGRVIDIDTGSVRHCRIVGNRSGLCSTVSAACASFEKHCPDHILSHAGLAEMDQSISGKIKARPTGLDSRNDYARSQPGVRHLDYRLIGQHAVLPGVVLGE